MLKQSKAAIKLRQIKWIYAPYLSLMSRFGGRSYKELKAFVLFLGYPRSGSSTLGSLLDAHKNIILSHELNVLNYIEKGYTNKQIYYLIEKNSRLFTQSGRTSSGYSGIVEKQYNSQAFPLQVIGDKKAGGTSLLLKNKPDLLSELKQCLGIPIKCIHIVRNPFDMITTQAYGGNEKLKQVSPEDIQNATSLCFQKFDTIDELLQTKQFDIYSIRHEALLENPKQELNALMSWLSLDASESYLEACGNHLYKKPHKSRVKYPWSDEEKRKVFEKISEIDFLKGYSFEN